MDASNHVGSLEDLMMPIRLVCLENAPERCIDAVDKKVVVGRADDVDIQITDRFVSRRHCTIEYQEGQLFVCDLKSRHGTWVNGERIESAHLKEGDILAIGLSKFRAETQEEVSASPLV